jgi:hypothetical protein
VLGGFSWATAKNKSSILSLKTVKISTIYMKDFVGIGGIQNHQSGCHPNPPFSAPIKCGNRQGVEQLVSRQQRAGR